MSEEAKWYVIHTYSGYENKVADSIINAVENRQLHHLISEVKIPTEIVVEVNDSKEKKVEHKLFPSYVFVRMIMTDDSWYVVRNIRGVTGFVGPGSKPIPLTKKEVAQLGIESDTTSERYEIDFKVGDTVVVSDGSFKGNIGTVTNIDSAAQKVTVELSFMGKVTPVEMDATQVSPI